MKISIAVCSNRKQKKYQNREVEWSDFVSRLSVTTRTSETVGEYRAMSKTQQSEKKDVGGFVGGFLKNGVRGKGMVEYRSIVTLDLDNCDNSVLERINAIEEKSMLGDGVPEIVFYSTHKHTDSRPRLRMIVPLSRKVDADGYEFIARTVAQKFDESMKSFDRTTFQPERMMFWPSTSKDGSYYFRHIEGSPIDVDRILAENPNWRDPSTWPAVDGEIPERTSPRKQEDPLKKGGFVGAFNRTYTIQKAIGEFLPDVYEPTESDDRYTYAKGSAYGGLVIYDGKLAYSHHGTDPVGGKEVNAFDLVRIHLYGDLDKDAKEGMKTTKLPSYDAMMKLCNASPKVKSHLDEPNAEDDFESDLEDADWTGKFITTKNGQRRPLRQNILLILNNDERIRGKIAFDDFSQLMVAVEDLPWRKVTYASRAFTDADTASLRVFIEKYYGITGNGIIDDAVMDYVQTHRVHPVRDYLNALKWDGVKRAETIFIDYLGAEDCNYVRQVTRIMLRAAVMRVFHPGIKFDTMVVLIGPQGIGKSTIIARLGRRWFSDSLKTFKGKEAMELIQGTWILEVSELAAMKKADVEDIKSFLSSTEDKFRAAYARKPALYPRQCILVGTSNRHEIFRDITGNRRFYPIDLQKDLKKKKKFFDTFDESLVDQIWAEVMTWNDQKLVLDYETESQAEAVQRDHMEYNFSQERIMEYLDTKLPEKAVWESMDVTQRREYLDDPEKSDKKPEMVRDRVCVKEIIDEVLRTPSYKNIDYEAKEVNSFMQSLDGWESRSSVRLYKPYKRSRGFVRVKKTY